MLTHDDQLSLLKLISKQLKKNITCYAFGGNAMMFYGYKAETKDVDLLFETIEDRDEFIKAIKVLGFQQSSPINVYVPEKLKDKHKPLMFSRQDYRLDLFVKKIFRTKLSPKMKEDKFAVHEFEKLRINVLRKEHLVYLKGITNRQNDFDDIRLILSKEKNFDWNYFIEEVLWQDSQGDTWALMDIEKMLKELKEYVFIEEKYFKRLYDSKK